MSSTKKPNQNLVREAINARLVELGVSPWHFSRSGQVDAVPSTIYRFLSGMDSKTDVVDQMMRALGLRVVADRKVPDWAKKLRSRAA